MKIRHDICLRKDNCVFSSFQVKIPQIKFSCGSMAAGKDHIIHTVYYLIFTCVVLEQLALLQKV